MVASFGCGSAAPGLCSAIRENRLLRGPCAALAFLECAAAEGPEPVEGLRRFGCRVPRMAVGSSAALSLFSAPSAVSLPSLRVLCVSAFAGRLRAHPPGSLRLAFSHRSNLRSKPKRQNVLSVALFQPDHLVAALPRQASAVFILTDPESVAAIVLLKLGRWLFELKLEPLSNPLFPSRRF